jgi:hypothetical protein
MEANVHQYYIRLQGGGLGDGLLAGSREAYDGMPYRGHQAAECVRDEAFILNDEHPCPGHDLLLVPAPEGGRDAPSLQPVAIDRPL